MYQPTLSSALKQLSIILDDIDHCREDRDAIRARKATMQPYQYGKIANLCRNHINSLIDQAQGTIYDLSADLSADDHAHYQVWGY